MGDQTLIAWTDHTFNPWMGCVKVSQGCKNCYAEVLIRERMQMDIWGPNKKRVRTAQSNWQKPVQWNREAQGSNEITKVFSGSLCDVFEDHPDLDPFRSQFFELIRKTPNLHWQLLTKRPENFRRFLPPDWGQGYPNVWLGTSIEDMRVASRVEHLQAANAIVRFISYEPALGPLHELDLSGIDWVIYGGESGRNYRPHDLAWPRAMRDKCKREGVAFFFKQSSAPRTEMGITLDGKMIREYPTPRTVVKIPEGELFAL